MKFWAGWYSGYYADEGCTKPPFEVWVTGYRPRPRGERDDCTICAVIEAENEVSVWEIVSQYFTDFLERFCEPKPDDWEPPLPRFPRN